MLHIALVGDRNDSIPAHQAIPLALTLAARSADHDVEPTWLPTEAVGSGDGLAAYDAIWCIPGSPYRSMDGALTAIRYAREKLVPFLGTCGGFQHAMIEYARNVCGLAGAEHAESSPEAALAIVTLLACPLLGAEGRVRLAPGSRLHAAYAAEHSLEEYQCRFGLEARWRKPLEEGGLLFSAFDDDGDVRGAELPSHPFFVATLFQPERAALRGLLPPLVRAFVRATSSRRSA